MSYRISTNHLIFLFLISCASGAFTQGRIDTALIKAQLKVIYARDQMTRDRGDSIKYVSYIDSCNLVLVEKLIALYGWPGKSFVGASGNYTVFLVIQHAGLATQEKYFPLMQASVDAGESRPADLAYLQDRILMQQGKKQLYGSQIVFNKTGGQELYPIEDERNVNIRRAKMGLQPLEEYAEHFGIEYKLPSQ
jgi:hypothetical protein